MQNFYQLRKIFININIKEKLKATLIFRIIKGLSPAYLRALFSIRSTKYNVRDSEIKLNLPKPRTNYCKRALGYSGALLWNSLPVNSRKSDSLGYFKRELVKFYSNCQSGSHTAILLYSVVLNIFFFN